MKNKKILVTGGTGSFGHQIVDRLLKLNPLEIRIFSNNEDEQYRMQNEYKDKNLRFIIGDVRDKNSLKSAMRDIDIVFHASALKHVPLCEYNVIEAVKTNIMGAYNVIETAKEENVAKVIAISTDKAVEPINVMGMSKAIQERLFVSANLHKDNKKTIFACVRYGNVLGSRGSVIPLFKKQIDNNESLTLTDKRMTRFIITLDEAIDLVFKSIKYSVGGEIFVPKIPSHTILDLAEVMLENSKKNLRIKIIGIRPAEKLHETLISPIEKVVEKDDFYIVLPFIKINEIEDKYKAYKKIDFFRFSSDTAERLNKEQLKRLLRKEGWLW